MKRLGRSEYWIRTDGQEPYATGFVVGTGRAQRQLCGGKRRRSWRGSVTGGAQVAIDELDTR